MIVGKTTLGKRLAKKINATQWRTPPNSISHLRNLFDDNKVLRTAFYSLGNYIAALEVQMILKYEPVVMDRYKICNFTNLLFLQFAYLYFKNILISHLFLDIGTQQQPML